MKGFAALLFASFLLAGVDAPHAADVQKPLVLTHATVIDVAGGPAKTDYTVVISGGRIVEMGETAKVPVPQGS